MLDFDQPPPAPLPGPPARQRRRDQVAAAATTVVVLVVSVLFFASRIVGSDSDDESGGLSSALSLAPNVCGRGDLVAGAQETEAAAGTTYLTATLELAPGAEPCSVDGYPGVIVLTNGVPAGVATTPDDNLGSPQELTVLPDRTVRVTLSWAVSHYCGPTLNDAIRLLVGPGLDVEIRGFGATTCSPGEGRPAVRFGPFTYVDPRAELGTVSGIVTLNDGPGLGTGQFVTSGEIEFAGDPDDYRAPIGENGNYELELPAGRYEVLVTTHEWNGGTPYSAGIFDVIEGELNPRNITLPLR